MIPYEFAGRDGGAISVPAGRYRVLCINNDVTSVIYTNVDRFENFKAYTTDASMTGLPRNISDNETKVSGYVMVRPKRGCKYRGRKTGTIYHVISRYVGLSIHSGNQKCDKLGRYTFF